MTSCLIRRSMAAITVTAALVVSMSACGGDDATSDSTIPPAADTTTAPTDPAPGPDPTEPTGPPAVDAIPVAVFMHLDEQVAPVRRHLDDLSSGVLGGTLEAWLAGPTPEEITAGYTSTVPAGTRLLASSFTDGVVTVDLSGQFASGGGTASVLGRLAELVMTASTSVMVLDGIELRIDGEPVSLFSSEGIEIDGLLTIDDVDQHLPAILVHSVLAGDEVANGTQVSGLADVFEAVVSLEVVDGSGVVIQSSTTMASCGTGCRGRFTTWLDLGEYSGPAVLRLFEVSARDGAEINQVSIPITVVG